MNGSSLIGQKVRVISNDLIPMDSAARIIYTSEPDKKFLLEMDTPIKISGVKYEYAVVSPILSKDNLNTLLQTRALGCSITWVSKDRFDQSKPLDLSWWRGGSVAITDVMLD